VRLGKNRLHLNSFRAGYLPYRRAYQLLVREGRIRGKGKKRDIDANKLKSRKRGPLVD